MASVEAAGSAEAASGEPPSRIARYDEVFDMRKRATVYRKSNSTDLAKHNQKLRKKNPILVVRRVFDNKGRHTTTQVDIKNWKLAAFLQGIYEGIEGVDVSRNPPWCNSKLLAHSAADLHERLQQEKVSAQSDEDFLHALEVALTFVDEDFGSSFLDAETLLRNTDAPSTTFDLLWTLFRPGRLLYAYDEYTDQSRILKAQTYEIKSTMQKGVYAEIRAHMLTHDGKTFGRAMVLFEILFFPGTRKLQDLAVYPLDYYPKHSELKQRALARGRKFVGMMKQESTFHEIDEGPAVYEVRNPDDWRFELRRFATHGRVMIDPSSYRTWQHGADSIINVPVMYRLDPASLSDVEYMLCTPIVTGFSFTTKQWGGYALDRLTDITWSSKPFDSLVLDPKTKDLVLSMVKQHREGLSNFDDIIKGKGKGLVGLLCGPPGCGKTLTAEAVAEATNCPLYSLSAGELGTKFENVESKLTQVLELAHKWKAVVLLDEADVFLAQRDSSDITRNALVSIFLRKLEYYQGILILTTNLISQCDVAFESRIHFTIHYPLLARESRRKIWKTFILQTSGKDRLSEKDIDDLSKIPLNGRQIKNSVSVAHSFASGASVLLSKDHIDTVLKVMRDWEKAKGGRTASYQNEDLTLGSTSRPLASKLGTDMALCPGFTLLVFAFAGVIFILLTLLRMAGWI